MRLIITPRYTLMCIASLLLVFVSTRAVSGHYAPINKPAGELPAGSMPELNHAEASNTVDFTRESDNVRSRDPVTPPKKIGSARSRVIPSFPIAVAAPAKQETKQEAKPLVSVSAKSVTESVNKPVGVDAVVQAAESEVPQEKRTDNRPTAQEKASEAKEISGPETASLRIEDVVETNEAYKFAGRDKVDPFVPPLGSVEITKVAKTVEADEIPIVSPLQYHALKQLAVTGVWQAEDNRWKAMVETPDQEGIITQVGDPIGNSGGHVANIGQNGIKVREYTLQKDGSRLYTDSVVAMAAETTIDHDSIGGKIILKPGIETPEVQRAQPHIDLTEDGFPVDSDPATKEQKKQDVAKASEIAIGPDADAALKEVVKRAADKAAKQDDMQEPGLLPPDLSPRSQLSPTPAPSPAPAATPIVMNSPPLIESLRSNPNVLRGGTL